MKLEEVKLASITWPSRAVYGRYGSRRTNISGDYDFLNFHKRFPSGVGQTKHTRSHAMLSREFLDVDAA